MKSLLLVAMLVLMGERWEPTGAEYLQVRPHPEGVANCVLGVLHNCFIVKDYRRVYVIGEIPYCPWGAVCSLEYRDMRPVEKYTVPVPNVPTKAMTREEAEKANR